MELIKAILEAIEETCDDFGLFSFDVEDFEQFENLNIRTLHGHIRLAAQGGLIECDDDKKNLEPLVRRLTWEGHEFLSNARDSKVWEAAKQAAGGLSFSVLTQVLSSLTLEYVKKKLSLS